MKIEVGKSVRRAPVGLSLAHEKGGLLSWDKRGGLALHGPDHGQVASAIHPGLAAACISANGQCVAVACKDGTVLLLGEDLATRSSLRVGGQPCSVAIDHRGRNIAVGLMDGTILFMNSQGLETGRLAAPCAATSMAFANRHPWLAFAGSAGMAGAADANGSLRWKEGLPHHLGPLSMAEGTGDWFVPRMGECVAHFGPLGAPHRDVPETAGARLVACDHMATNLAIVEGGSKLKVTDKRGVTRASIELPVAITAIAMNETGATIMAGLDDRRILWIRP
ncbi:MAG: hypothetical protein ACKO26_27410 [Planctomycetota bacterium]